MLKNLKKRKELILLCLLAAVLVSFIGVALSKTIVINSLTNRIGVSGIYRDGWTEPNSSIDLSKLPEGLRKVHLVFDPWRPTTARSAAIVIKLCGNKVAEFILNKDRSDLWLAIPENCQDGILAIEVANPFKSQDGRILGASFVEADFKFHLRSSLNLDQTAIYSSICLILIVLAIFWLQMPLVFSLAAISVLFLTATSSLAFLSWDNQFQLLFLSGLIFLLLVGARLKVNSSLHTNNLYTPLLLIVTFSLLGAGLRFYGIDFGLPERYHPDEPRKAQIALNMVQTGKLDPNYFLHPSLLLYLTALFTKISYSLGLSTQLDSVHANLCGRIVSAVAGSLSIPLVFLLGRQLLNTRIATIACGIFAFSPLAITSSRFLKEDSLLLFFVLLSAYIAFLSVNRKSLSLLLLAGFCSGLAAGSKYSGVLAFVAVAATPWFKSKQLWPNFRQLIWVILALFFVPIGFFVTTPYALINSSKFISHFIAEKEHMITGHHKVIISSWSQYWMYHFSRSLPSAVSWPVLVASLIAFGAILKNFKINALIVLGLFLTFYLPAESVNAKVPPQPERYIFPCLPFVALAAGYLCDVVRMRSLVFSYLLAAALILAPAYRSIGLAQEIKPDTRVLMGQWISEHIPAGSTIMVDAQPYSAFLPKDKFSIIPIWSIPHRRTMTADNLRRQGIQYLLLTSPSYERYFQTRSADQLIREKFEDVFNNWELVSQISPKFGFYGFHNPVLRLYKVPNDS
jgi:4-amino-4-deoxy-L-arabinose transferase-like glycosyltransferase